MSYSDHFEILADGREARGKLDHAAYVKPAALDPGPHEYLPATGESHVVVIWSEAVQRDPHIASVSVSQ